MNAFLNTMILGFSMTLSAFGQQNAMPKVPAQPAQYVSLPLSVADGMQYQLFITPERDTLLAVTRYDAKALRGKGEKGTLATQSYHWRNEKGMLEQGEIHDYAFAWKNTVIHAGKNRPDTLSRFITDTDEVCLIRQPDTRDIKQIKKFCDKTGNINPLSSAKGWIDVTETADRALKTASAHWKMPENMVSPPLLH